MAKISISQSCNILLIDEDQNHSDLVRFILSRQYNDSITIASSRTGVETAQKSSPDLIMLRLMLIGGVDGFALCRQLKSQPHLQHVSVLLFGAKAQADVYAQAKLCGASGYLYQPFTPDQLCTARETLLANKPYFP